MQRHARRLAGEVPKRKSHHCDCDSIGAAPWADAHTHRTYPSSNGSCRQEIVTRRSIVRPLLVRTAPSIQFFFMSLVARGKGQIMERREARPRPVVVVLGLSPVRWKTVMRNQHLSCLRRRGAQAPTIY
jgi:hypothetical protein